MTTGFTFPTVPTTGKFTSTLLKQIINFRRANAANGSVRSVSQDDLDDADFGTINEAIVDLDGKGGTIIIKNSESNYVVPTTGFDLTTDPDWLIVGQTKNLITLDCTGVTGQIFKVNATNTKIDIENIDFINVAAGVPIVNATATTTCLVKFVDCDIEAVSGGVFLSETFDMSVELERVTLTNFTTTLNLVPATASVGTVRLLDVTTNGLITLKSTATTIVRLSGSSAITMSGTGTKNLSGVNCSTLTLTGGNNTLQSINASSAVSISDNVNCTGLTCTTLACTINVVSVLNTITCTTLVVAGSADLTIIGLNHSGAFSSSHTGTVLLQNVTATSSPSYTFSAATIFILKQAIGINGITYNQSVELRLEDVSCTTLTTASSSGKVVLTNVTSSGNMTLTGTGELTGSAVTCSGATLLITTGTPSTINNLTAVAVAFAGTQDLTINGFVHTGAVTNTRTAGDLLFVNVDSGSQNFDSGTDGSLTLSHVKTTGTITYSGGGILKLDHVTCSVLTTASSTGVVDLNVVTTTGTCTLTGTGKMIVNELTSVALVLGDSNATLSNVKCSTLAISGSKEISITGVTLTGALTNTNTGSVTINDITSTTTSTFTGSGAFIINNGSFTDVDTTGSSGVIRFTDVTVNGTLTLGNSNSVNITGSTLFDVTLLAGNEYIIENTLITHRIEFISGTDILNRLSISNCNILSDIVGLSVELGGQNTIIVLLNISNTIIYQSGTATKVSVRNRVITSFTTTSFNNVYIGDITEVDSFQSTSFITNVSDITINDCILAGTVFLSSSTTSTQATSININNSTFHNSGSDFGQGSPTIGIVGLGRTSIKSCTISQTAFGVDNKFENRAITYSDVGVNGSITLDTCTFVNYSSFFFANAIESHVNLLNNTVIFDTIGEISVLHRPIFIREQNSSSVKIIVNVINNTILYKGSAHTTGFDDGLILLEQVNGGGSIMDNNIDVSLITDASSFTCFGFNQCVTSIVSDNTIRLPNLSINSEAINLSLFSDDFTLTNNTTFLNGTTAGNVYVDAGANNKTSTNLDWTVAGNGNRII